VDWKKRPAALVDRKKWPAAPFSDNAFVPGGKRRDFCRLLSGVDVDATMGI
jgi:hypothetical protein